jgi:predicted secreted protein
MNPARLIQSAIVGLFLLALVAQLFLPAGGINFVTGIAIYLTSWWVVLFTILPLGITGQAESGEVVQGTESGAPVNPGLKRKAWLTTVAAAVIWLTLFAVFEFGLVSLDDIPFIPGPDAWDA